jgi:hypothetical protein
MTISVLSNSNNVTSLYTSTGLPMVTIPVSSTLNQSSSVSFSDIAYALNAGSPLSVAQLIYLNQQNPAALTMHAPIALSDTASAIQGNLTILDQLSSNGLISSISLTNNTPPQFSMSPNDFINSAGILNSINSPYAVQVTQPFTVDQVSNLGSTLANKFVPLDVADSVSNILSNANWLNQTSPQINYIITDTAQNISSNFNALATLPSIQSVTIAHDANVSSQNQNLLTITDSQLNSNPKLIAKLPANYLLSITNASAADAVSLQKNVHVENFQISDTAQNISNNISGINSVSKPMSINVIDSAQNISIYSSQLNQLKSIYTTNLTSPLPDIIAQSNNLNHLKSTFAINITTPDLLNNLDSLQGLSKLNAVNLTDAVQSETLTLTADQYARDKSVINKIIPAISVHLTNVHIADLRALAQDSKVQSVDIVDNISNITSDTINLLNSVSNINSLLYFNSSRLAANSANANPLNVNSFTINVNNTNSNSNIALLSNLKIPNNVNAIIPQLTINAQGILNFNTAGGLTNNLSSTFNIFNQLTHQSPSATFWPKNINISDTASNLAKYATNNSTTFTDTPNISYSVTDGINAAQVNAQALASLPSYSLSDTGLNLSNNFTWLSANDHISALTISDSANTLSLTSAQLLSPTVNPTLSPNATSFLTKIQNPNYKVVITNSPAMPLTCADAQWLNSGPSELAHCQILSMPIVDTSSNLQTLLQPSDGSSSPALNWNNITSITLSDSSTTTPTITLTAANYLVDQKILNKITSPYNLVITNAKVNQISNPSNSAYVLANSNIKSFTLNDTSAHITANLNALTSLVKQNKLTALSLTDTPNAISLTPAQIQSAQNLLSKISSLPNLTISGMHIADIPAMDALKSKFTFTPYAIIDTASNISDAIAANATTLQSEVSSLSISDANNSLKLDSTLLAKDNSNIINSPILDYLNSHINGLYKLQFTGLTIANMKSLVTPTLPNAPSANLLAHISGYSISDQPENIAADLASNSSALLVQNNANKIQSISVNPAGSLIDLASALNSAANIKSNSDILNLSSLLGHMSNVYSLKLSINANSALINSLLNSGLGPHLKNIAIIGSPSPSDTAYARARISLVALLGSANVQGP